MQGRSLSVSINATGSACVLIVLAVILAATGVVVVIRKDAAARKSATRAEMLALCRALVRYTIYLHLMHDLPIPDHVMAVGDAPADAAGGSDNGSSSSVGAVRENENGRSEAVDGDDGGDTTVAYSMPESTASARYERSLHEIAGEEYAEVRHEYEYGDGDDWFDAMMRMREADY